MGGQAHFKHASERGVGGHWTKIRGEFKGKGRQICGFWITFVVDCIESKACRSE